MNIIQVGNNKYVDDSLAKYINNIWLNYDIEVDKDSNIYFMKNTTINRLITDYCGKNISRVIKKEKADYCIINKFDLGNFPQYYDVVTNTITEDDTKDIVYGVYNQSMEVQDSIDLIVDFINRKQEVKYVNQNKLNDSLNNGFVLDVESYTTIKELIDSTYPDNHKLAVNMLVQSDLKSNWEWILYLYYDKYNQIYDHDKKDIIPSYFTTLNLGHSLKELTNKLDLSMFIVKNNRSVLDRFIHIVRDRFNKNIKEYMSKTLKTDKFVLEDFKLKWNEN